MVNKLMIAFCEEQKRDHDPCVLLINQTRYKPGVMFGDPETMPGGEAQKFLSSLRVRLHAKNIIDKATNMVMFKETRVVVKKAKVPVRAASFEFSLCVHAHDDCKSEKPTASIW
jgi:RecA/RadA recombinase